MTGGRVTSAAVAAVGAADTRFTLDFRAADGTWQRGPLVSCLGARFEDVPPVREFRFEKGLRNFAGWWYFATTGTHIGFESWLERDHLMLMDFDPAVAAVASQPFWLRWRDEEGPRSPARARLLCAQAGRERRGRRRPSR